MILSITAGNIRYNFDLIEIFKGKYSEISRILTVIAEDSPKSFKEIGEFIINRNDTETISRYTEIVSRFFSKHPKFAEAKEYLNIHVSDKDIEKFKSIVFIAQDQKDSNGIIFTSYSGWIVPGFDDVVCRKLNGRPVIYKFYEINSGLLIHSITGSRTDAVKSFSEIPGIKESIAKVKLTAHYKEAVERLNNATLIHMEHGGTYTRQPHPSAPQVVEPAKAVAQPAAKPASTTKSIQFTIKSGPYKGSLELYFPEKPSEQICSALKSMGMKWHNLKKCWYGYKTETELKAAIA